jgi:broad specificity phosphatase PhoE
MTIIYLARHGQTDWNKQEIFRGRKDIPLNERGRQEAEALSKHLEPVKFSACFSSPLSRAFDTAEIVARPHGLSVEVDEGMIDINYGDWEGVGHEEIKKRFPELYEHWHTEPHRIRFPGGESLSIVRKRALSSLERIRTNYPDGTVFIVSHRAVTKIVMCAMLGLSNKAYWRIIQDNCAYNIIKFEKDGPVVSALNDTCHLQYANIMPSLADF